MLNYQRASLVSVIVSVYLSLLIFIGNYIPNGSFEYFLIYWVWLGLFFCGWIVGPFYYFQSGHVSFIAGLQIGGMIWAILLAQQFLFNLIWPEIFYWISGPSNADDILIIISTLAIAGLLGFFLRKRLTR